MNKKTIFLFIIIALLVIFGVYKGFIQKKKPTFTLAKVSRGTVSQEVSETGTVEKGEEIKLAFKSTGKIKRTYVKVGDVVKSDDKLSELDSSQLSIQLNDAEASLAVAEADLNKLLSGASPEEIKVSQTDIQNSQIAMDTAKENLNQSYEDAVNTLDDSYLKLYNTFSAIDVIYKRYFTGSDQESIKFKDSKDFILLALNRTKSYLDIVNADNKTQNIDLALSETKASFDIASNSLAILRTVCDEGIYYSSVSSTDKASIDTQRTNINTALTNITVSQQSISSMKLSLKSAEGNLQKAQDQLALLTAKPRQEDIDLYQAQINEAQAKIDLIMEQIKESAIFSPTAGQITIIDKKEGEIAQASEGVIYLIPADPFQVKVDIYEEDVVKIRVGNPVNISLTAFPNEFFKGKIISIDPAETLKEGVVYYETTIDFDNPPEKIKPGMTADMTIIAMTKENVLVIPQTSMTKKDSKIFVQVLTGKKIEERKIETGLEGSNGIIEITLGLQEGEEIIINQ